MGSPDEMIRANGAAEAAQADRLKAEIGAYSRQLAELRALYEKNNALVEKLQVMNASAADSVRSLAEQSASRLEATSTAVEELSGAEFQRRIVDSIGGSQQKIAELLQQSDEFAHKENVRVYRNIQASMISELEKQTKTLQGSLDDLAARLARIEEDMGEPVKPAVTGVQIAILVCAVLAAAGGILQFAGVDLAFLFTLFG